MQPTTNDPDGPMGTLPQQRSSVRVMVQLDATIDDGRVPRMYQTQNLSTSGMLLRTQKPMPIGTKVDVQFLFPDDPVRSKSSLPGGYGFVEGEAVVVRHTNPVKEAIRGMALQFVGLEDRGKALLTQFLGGQNGNPVGPATA